MDKNQIIKIIKKYKLDKSKFIVISGAALVLLGIKKTANDIDIWCDNDYCDYLLNNYDCKLERINEFGEKYSDVSQFEAEFANNPLNSEYMNIFVEIAKKEVDASQPGVGDVVADRVGSEIKNRVMPSRAVRADARDQAIRNIPIVGDVVDIGQKIDLFNKFRKNKQ